MKTVVFFEVVCMEHTHTHTYESLFGEGQPSYHCGHTVHALEVLAEFESSIIDEMDGQ